MTTKSGADFCLLLAVNPIEFDFRLLRLSQALEQRVAQVIILGLGEALEPDFPGWPARVRLASRPLAQVGGAVPRAALSALSYLRLVLETAGQLRGRKGLVWAVDADTLAFGWLVSKLLGCPLIYDAHEFWPAESRRRGLTRLLQQVERSLIGRAQGVVTVSPAIAAAYQDLYRLARRPVVLLNAPSCESPSPPAPLNLGRSGVPTLLYQGHLHSSRRLLEFIGVFRELAPPMRLALVGYGPLANRLRALQGPDLVVHGPIAPRELLSVTRTASAGLLLLDGDNVNHQMSLCNKLFEYIHAGIPILASAVSPQTNEILEQFGVGTVFVGYSRQAVAEGLTRLRTWLENPAKFRPCFEAARSALCWEQESRKLDGLLAAARGCCSRDRSSADV
ncbi:MAG: glycosyltransferase [Candidatus Eremiobacteraeota bacterium]|nr:glycosyltransferase [Candidatus Eremiobacteraeota bacterium]